MQRPKFPTELKLWKYEIERIASRLGLDFGNVVYEMVNADEMNELAAYWGFPVRWHHWSFGQESLNGKRSHRYGLGHLYEMIINTEPSYAYLMDTNSVTEQKTVIAHCCGHADFFTRNMWFGFTRKDMHNVLGDNAARIETLRSEYGKEEVDKFLEAALSLANLVDLMAPVMKRAPLVSEKKETGMRKQVKRIRAREGVPTYLEDFINTQEYLKSEEARLAAEAQREEDIAKGQIVPEEPVRDILGFIALYGPLTQWQREILKIIRDEMEYFFLGAQTKVMNEGWAAFWHARIMAEEGAALDSEFCSFARMHAGVVSGGDALNPYRLGMALWEYIEYSWNVSRYGRIYTECRDASILERWDKFIVFKALWDRYGGYTAECRNEYNVFATLLRETHEGRGATHPAFFTNKNIVPEWHNFEHCEGRFPYLRMMLRRLEEYAAEHFSSREEAMAVPASFKKWRSLREKYPKEEALKWSISELESQLAYYTALSELKRKIFEGETDTVSDEVPPEWVQWAAKYPSVELMRGNEKIFEVRETYTDVNFVQDFFTEDFCEEQGFFTYGIDKGYPRDNYVLRSRGYDRIKFLIISRYLNLGSPKVEIVDANYNNNRELLLVHCHDGRDLDEKDIAEVLRRLHMLWGGKKFVHLETLKTEYQPKRDWWWYWRPPNSAPPHIPRPKRSYIHYRHDGKELHTGHSERKPEPGKPIQYFGPGFSK